VEPTSSAFHRIFRNLALAATAALALCLYLSNRHGLDFLAVLVQPLLAAAALSWLACSVVWLWGKGLWSKRLITSAQGPGGETLQKATVASVRHEEGLAGTEAEQHFLDGERRFAAGDYAGAVECYQRSVAARPNLPACLNLGAALLNAADFAQAEEVLTAGLGVARRRRGWELEAAFEANLGAACARRGRLTPARHAYENALELFGRIHDRRGQADARLGLAGVLMQQGEWAEARRCYEAARRGHRRSGSGLGQANDLSGLGVLHAYEQQLEEAVAHHRAALAQHEDVGNLLGRAHALNNLGNAHFQGKQLQQATAAYTTALDLYRKTGNRLGQATSLGNLGNVLFRQGQLEQALARYEEALVLHEGIGNVVGRADTLTNIGSLYARRRQGQQALEILGQARTLYLDTGARGRGLEAVDRLIERLRLRMDRHARRRRGDGA
jgi:tetratricopeptide (TPR) repeat protein